MILKQILNDHDLLNDEHILSNQVFPSSMRKMSQIQRRDISAQALLQQLSKPIQLGDKFLPQYMLTILKLLNFIRTFLFLIKLIYTKLINYITSLFNFSTVTYCHYLNNFSLFISAFFNCI